GRGPFAGPPHRGRRAPRAPAPGAVGPGRALRDDPAVGAGQGRPRRPGGAQALRAEGGAL
ncbi:MAG: hypothetical protein AVDCRST_MAG89-2910, partial [uncultured Gemmatimonadetes bacterium]